MIRLKFNPDAAFARELETLRRKESIGTRNETGCSNADSGPYCSLSAAEANSVDCCRDADACSYDRRPHRTVGSSARPDSIRPEIAGSMAAEFV